MLSFFRKNKNKPLSKPTNTQQENIRPKTRSQSKQEQLNSISTPIPIQIKPSNQHQEQQQQQHQQHQHQQSKEINSKNQSIEHKNKSPINIRKDNPSIHFILNDIPDIQSYLTTHHPSSHQTLSLFDLLNSISSHQSSHHPSQPTLSIQLHPIQPLKPLNHHHSSSNQTLKANGKRRIEEEDELSEFELINPSPSSSSHSIPFNSFISKSSNHTTPTKKIKLHQHPHQFNLIQSKSNPIPILQTRSNSKTTHSNPIQLVHGLSIEIWNQIFQILNQSSLHQTFNPFSTHVHLNPNQMMMDKASTEDLIRSQAQSHQFQLISKSLLPSTRSTAWSFLILNNFHRIQSVTRLLESNSSLSQLINTCYIILPTNLSSSSLTKTPLKPNRQSMIFLNDDLSSSVLKDESNLPIHSRSTTLLTSLINQTPTKPNPIYSNPRRIEKHHQSPSMIKLKRNEEEARVESDPIHSSLLDLPSLLFSLSTNLKRFYMIGPELVSTKVLKSLSSLSTHLTSLESLTIIGGGDLHGLFNLINGLCLLPKPSGLKKLKITGPLLTLNPTTHLQNQNQNQTPLKLGISHSNLLMRSHSISKSKINHSLSLEEVLIGNGLSFRIEEVFEMVLKVKENSLKRLKLKVCLPEHEYTEAKEEEEEEERRKDRLGFREVFRMCSMSLEELVLEEDWFLISRNSSERERRSSSSKEEEEEEAEGKKKRREEREGILDLGLNELRVIKVLDFSELYSTSWVSFNGLNRLPKSLELIKLRNPTLKLMKRLIENMMNEKKKEGEDGFKRLKRIEIFANGGSKNLMGRDTVKLKELVYEKLNELNRLGIQIEFK